MRLNSLTVAGFRGFNTEKTIDFHPQLTVIAAPNSHGKTSVSEALEFLFFGATSKVEHADSKEEYQDSYRNRHFSTGADAFIQAELVHEGATITIRVQIDATGGTRRFVDGKPVTTWPFEKELREAARPFILQHALKYLLLVPPSERFQAFANLLGLNEMDRLQQVLVNLCTKPDARISSQARKLLSDLETNLGTLAGIKELANVTKLFKKDRTNWPKAWQHLESRADVLLRQKTDTTTRLPGLLRLRDEATAKVFSGSINIGAIAESDQGRIVSKRDNLTRLASSLPETCGKLSISAATERIKKQFQLFELGSELMVAAPESCPLCAQTMNPTVQAGFAVRHEKCKTQMQTLHASHAAQKKISEDLKVLLDEVPKLLALALGRVKSFLTAAEEPNREKIRELLRTQMPAWKIIGTAMSAIAAATKAASDKAKILNDSVTQHQADILASATKQSKAQRRGFSNIPPNTPCPTHSVRLKPALPK